MLEVTERNEKLKQTIQKHLDKGDLIVCMAGGKVVTVLDEWVRKRVFAMKLLQLNIWAGRLLPAILKLIDQEQPDILCLQEVLSSSKEIRVPAIAFNSLERIQDRTGHTHSFFSPMFSTTFASHKVSYRYTIILISFTRYSRPFLRRACM